MRMQSVKTLFFLLFLGFCSFARADHAFGFDDPDTHGIGKGRVEAVFGHERGNSGGLKFRNTETSLGTFYGIREDADLLLDVPYFRSSDSAGNGATGFGDVALGAKWRAFEYEGSSIGFKGFVKFPTGNDNVGLGYGKANYLASAIFTKQFGSWDATANLNFETRFGSPDGERRSVPSSSLALGLKAREGMRLVANYSIRQAGISGDPTERTLLFGASSEFGKEFEGFLSVKKRLTGEVPETGLYMSIGRKF